jgi:hypothetical protein
LLLFLEFRQSYFHPRSFLVILTELINYVEDLRGIDKEIIRIVFVSIFRVVDEYRVQSSDKDKMSRDGLIECNKKDGKGKKRS